MGRDRYVPTGIDGSLPEQRVVEAAVHLPDTGAITGWGALRMAGAAYFDGRTRWRRSTVVAEALPLCSERSRSPAETRLRMVYELDARLPTPQVNRTVYDLSGRLLCVADLFDEEAGMVVEYDGAEHRKVRRHARDVRREDLGRRSGSGRSRARRDSDRRSPSRRSRPAGHGCWSSRPRSACGRHRTGRCQSARTHFARKRVLGE